MFLIQEGSKIIGYCESSFDIHMLFSKNVSNFDGTDLKEKQLDNLKDNQSITLCKMEDGSCKNVIVTRLKELKEEEFKKCKDCVFYEKEYSFPDSIFSDVKEKTGEACFYTKDCKLTSGNNNACEFFKDKEVSK